MIDAAASLARNTRERRHLLDRREALVRLVRQEHVPDHRLARDAVRLRLVLDLRLNQRRADVAGADGVAGDAVLGGLERRYLGQARPCRAWRRHRRT